MKIKLNPELEKMLYKSFSKFPTYANSLIKYCKKNPEKAIAIASSSVATYAIVDNQVTKHKHKKEMNLMKEELIKVNLMKDDAIYENEKLEKNADILLQQNLALTEYITKNGGDIDGD